MADNYGMMDDRPPLRVLFLHLDWGIGGAEQLMLQLAQASVVLGHSIQLWTTKCDPHHCFAPLKPNTGALHPLLHVVGQWIPPTLLIGNGVGRALCSNVRLLYLSYQVSRHIYRHRVHEPPPDVIVLDGLPTPLPFLQYFWAPTASLLFYCHFPDQLLTTAQTAAMINMETNDEQHDKNNNENTSATETRTTTVQPQMQSVRKGLYRQVMDGLENRTLPFADTIVVNSQFTRQTVLNTFSSLQQPPIGNNDSDVDVNGNSADFLPVLYPALDTTALDNATVHQDAQFLSTLPYYDPRQPPPLVSLNRYECKKNIKLLLEAILWIHNNNNNNNNHNENTVTIPPVVIAGGYDPTNMENIEYRGELQQFVETQLPSSLQSKIWFRHSISDVERTFLLKHALAVVYTPALEHFGIVPVEAMYCETPVIAVNSGGPRETVVPGVTGFLCEPTPAAFGQAILQLLPSTSTATSTSSKPLYDAKVMGQAARRHVVTRFGQERFYQQWKQYVEMAWQKGRVRQQRQQAARHLIHTLIAVADLVVTLWIMVLAVKLLQRWGVVPPTMFSIKAWHATLWQPLIQWFSVAVANEQQEQPVAVDEEDL
ncbi:hypothetical protein ACA910_016356 [Epithemia clementina (nom. ined.)]